MIEDLNLNFDFGGVEIEDVNLSDFDLQIGYNEETRYCKPKLHALKSNQIIYNHAVELARDIDIRDKQRYDVVVSGNFIFGDYIEAFLKYWNAKCLKMTISTLSMSQDNVDSLENLLKGGYIDELNIIVSAYFYSHERRSLIPYMYKHLDKDNRFQLAVAGVHTKTCHFKTLGGKHVVIHGSANLRSSGNIEQFTIEDNEELYNFYDGMFDDILSRYKTINKQIRGNDLWDIINNKKRR